ncbi:MAG: GGDEF domain-containing protein [Treponema sp.]|nr:GGDEF domain-containing protein [Treponema sp.]
MKRFFLSLCFSGIFLSTGAVFFANTASPIVKVGYFQDDPLYKKTGNDDNESYVIEFLETLQHYTDYDFSMVEVDRNNAENALRTGVVDVLPFFGREIQNSSNYLFSNIPTATGVTVLASNRNPDLSHITIGLNKMSPDDLIRKIDIYCDEQGISHSYRRYSEEKQLFADLYNGKIDVFATMDFSMPDDLSVISTIETVFLYLTTRSSDQILYEKLNTALTTLFSLNPSFLSTLRLKYIPSARYSINRLTLKEQKVVQEHNTIRIAALVSQEPYSSYANGHFKGIIIDQLDSISRTSGLTFTYLPAKTYADAARMVYEGKAEAIYGISDSLSAEDQSYMKTSNPLITQKIVCVTPDENLQRGNCAFYSVRGYQYKKSFLEKRYIPTSFYEFDTTAECLKALEKATNAFTLLPLHEAEYYFNNHLLTKLSISGDAYINNICIGLSRSTPQEYASILDKSIYMLTTSMFETFMQQNIQETKTISAFVRKHPVAAIVTTTVFLLIIATTVFLIIFIETKRRKDKQIRQAMNLANRDHMTGLYNHVAFEKMVTKTLEHAEEQDISAFVMIDIDNFKKVNDTLGHANGDYVIVSVANILISTFRQGDLKSRMGGDEFAVFMKNVSDIESLEKKMKALQQAIKNYFENCDINVKVTCSIGVSWCTGPQENAFSKMYNTADAGLYAVKREGKNAFSIVQME